MDFDELFSAGILKISEIISLGKKYQSEVLENFFTIMEVWGTHIKIDTERNFSVNGISSLYTEKYEQTES